MDVDPALPNAAAAPSEIRLKAFDFAEETTKQLITIAAAVLTLTITFVKELVGDVSGWSKYALGVTWFLSILSIVAGLTTLGALTAELEPAIGQGNDSASNPSIRSRDVVVYSKAQGVLFLGGMVSLFVFGIATYW